LAEAGFLVIAIDYRLGAANPHPAASRDVIAAIRWARLNAARLGGDANRIGLVGASAGAHLAMLAGLRPHQASHRGVSIYDARGRAGLHDDISAEVDFVIALWPVSDPLYRYRYAKRAGLAGLVAASEAYFGDETAMLDASATRIVIAGEASRLPPMLIVQPGADSNIPQEMTLDFIRAYQARDGAVEYAFYPGQPHSFGTSASAQTDHLIALMADFAHRIWTQ
jgi:acetyl esterase/lipase